MSRILSRFIIPMTISGIVCVGGGWMLYCMTPAGAAEREYTRQQTLAHKLSQEPKKI